MINYLQHYGVLGMKWGVRRKLKPGEDRSKPTFNTEQVSVKVGSSVYRISTLKKENNIGKTFIFTDKKDAVKFGNKMLEMDPKNKSFLLEMKVKDTILAPSEAERAAIFIEGYRNTKIRDIINGIGKDAKKQGIDMSDPGGSKDLEAYRAYTLAVAKNAYGIGDAVTKGVNRLGFNALSDDYMRGYTKLSPKDKTPIDSLDSAMIVFARENTLEFVGSSELKSRKN